MKKSLILLIMPILLASCKKNAYDTKDLNIVSPTGAPAIALSYFAGFKNFQTNSDATNIVAMLKAGNADLAVLPTNVGIQAIRQANLPYKIAASLTHGNIYIASTGNDDDGIMDADDYIVSFQKGAVPDKIFHFVYKNTYDNALHYVSSAQEAAKCLKSGKNLADDGKAVDYVVLAEPALSTVLSSTPTANEYINLQEVYKVKSNGIGIFQASLFVKKDLNYNLLHDDVLLNIEKSISKMESDGNSVIEYMNQNTNPEATFGVAPQVASNMFKNGNRMNIDYKKVSDEKEGVNLFLSIFGLEPLKDEEIFK